MQLRAAAFIALRRYCDLSLIYITVLLPSRRHTNAIRLPRRCRRTARRRPTRDRSVVLTIVGMHFSASASNIAEHVVTVPKFYRKVHVRPGKFSSDDFDYRRYNKTDLVAIEALVPNAYCTAALLVGRSAAVERGTKPKTMGLSTARFRLCSTYARSSRSFCSICAERSTASRANFASCFACCTTEQWSSPHRCALFILRTPSHRLIAHY